MLRRIIAFLAKRAPLLLALGVCGVQLLLASTPGALGVPVTPPPPLGPTAQPLYDEAPLPPREPLTSMVPAMITAPDARRSRTPVPLVVIVTPAGMLIVVKL